MIIKRLLLGSAAVLVAASGAQAADAVIAPEPEAVEYVRVCDAYGAGYFYIPGTETCLRISGYVRADFKGGDDVYEGNRLDTWKTLARFTLRTHTASETELGTLKTFTETRFNFGDGENKSTTLKAAYIQLGGLQIGKADSAFQTFSGYLGDVINDDVVAVGASDTNLISYTFTGGNGFSAIISAEQGGETYVLGKKITKETVTIDGEDTVISREVDNVVNNRITDYMPHVVGGLKFEQAWGAIAAVAAYDSVLEEWAGKLRLDVNVTDQFSAWVQGGYASYEAPIGMYGAWGGEWAVWGGVKFKATDKAIINVQAAHEDWGKTAVTANIAYQLVPGFTITPEVSYTKWKRNDKYAADIAGKDAVGGIIRFQRSF